MPATVLYMLAAVAAEPAVSTLEVDIQGRRNLRGTFQACLMSDRSKFPDCGADPKAIRLTVRSGVARIVFERVPPGDYALSIFHDENANGRFDTLFGIPKEGFGFSRNPVIRFGAPRYNNASIQLGPGLTRIQVRLQYLL